MFSNLRGDQPAKLRVRYEDLRHVNERIVCVSLSGFGQTGPRVAQGAYDYTMQGLAGWQSVTGEPDGPPVKSGLSLVDYCGGYVAAIAMLAGVLRARRDGVGADVDLSLFEVALAQLTYISTWVASRDFEPRAPPGLRAPVDGAVPERADRWTAGSWSRARSSRSGLRLCAVLERPDLATDERSATFAARSEHREDVLGELFAIFRTRPTAEWLELLGARASPRRRSTTSRPRSPTRRSPRARVLAEFEHPVLGTVRQVASPLRVDGEVPPVAARRVPRRAHGRRAARRCAATRPARSVAWRRCGALGEESQ